MTEKITRWAIVGTGKAASLFAEGLLDAPGAKLVGVASRNADRGRVFGSHFGTERVYDSLEALANDGSVDVVYVATPNAHHHGAALALLEAGKPLICEKPFTVNAREAREIVTVARRKRVFCMEGMWMRFIPAVRELVELVRSGGVGDARSATIELGHPFTFNPTHSLFRPDGGGALLDLGPYVVSLALLLFGRPTRVQSEATFARSGADEHVVALLTHAEGRTSSVAVSLRTRLSNGATIAGTEAFARLHEPLYRPEAFSVAAAKAQQLDAPTGRPSHLRRRLRGAAHSVRSVLRPFVGERTTVHRCKGNGYQYEAIEAMRCLRAGELESPLMPLDASVQVMETLDAIRSAWTRV